MRPRELAVAQLLVAQGYRGVVRVRGELVADGPVPSRQAYLDALAQFPLDPVDDAAFETVVGGVKKDAAVDDVPAVTLALIRAARTLPPTATDAELRAEAKRLLAEDRRAVRGGRP